MLVTTTMTGYKPKQRLVHKIPSWGMPQPAQGQTEHAHQQTLQDQARMVDNNPDLLKAQTGAELKFTKVYQQVAHHDHHQATCQKLAKLTLQLLTQQVL